MSFLLSSLATFSSFTSKVSSFNSSFFFLLLSLLAFSLTSDLFSLFSWLLLFSFSFFSSFIDASIFLASFLIFKIGIFAYKAGAPFVPSAFSLFVSLTSMALSSTSIYFLITSIISCFINSKKSADTFALSCIKTKCSLSFAAVFELFAAFPSFFPAFLKKFTMFSNIIYTYPQMFIIF